MKNHFSAGHILAGAMLFTLPVCQSAGQTRIDLRTQGKGLDIEGHFASTSSPHTAGGIDASAKTGNGQKFQMSGATPKAAGIVIYDAAGNVVASNCQITEDTLSCGQGDWISMIALPELRANGSNAFVMHGAPAQSGDGCIVLSGQPAPGEALRATTVTILDEEGRTCVVMEWSTPSTSDLAQIPVRRYADLQEIPATFPAAAHAEAHRHGGSDEIAAATPGANAIPKAGADGRLAGGWLPHPTTWALGGVQATDCSATGFLQKINTDGTVTCASGGAGGTGGGVTNVGLAMPKGFTVTGSPVTSAGTLTAALAELGTAYVISEEFPSSAAVVGNGMRVSQAGSYWLMNVNGAGTIVRRPSSNAMVGVWQVQSGAASGNDSTFALLDDPGAGAAGAFPAPSDIPYTYETRISLEAATNSYFAAGLMTPTGGAIGFSNAVGIWCAVTNEASAGLWTCYVQRYSGGWQTTGVTLSPAPTADTNAHRIKLVVTGTQVDFYFDGAKAGCANSDGTGGCTATSNIPASPLTPAWEVKTTAAAQAKMNVDSWRFVQ